MWVDPYILGFTYVSIGGWAKALTGGKIAGTDIVHVYADTYAAVTNTNGVDTLRLAIFISDDGKDLEFNRGQDNAETLFKYGHNQLKNEETNAVVQEATRRAKTISAQPSRDQIANFVAQVVWVDEAKLVTARKERRVANDKEVLAKLNEFDGDQLAQDLRTFLDANKAETDANAAKLKAIVDRVAAEIGQAPIARTAKGEAFVHPRLLEVLKQPENRGAAELLQMGLSIPH